MRHIVALAAVVTAGQAQAQDWEYTAFLYGWFPDTRVTLGTPAGEVEGELSVGDALKSLDVAFMGALYAQRGPWGVLTDAMYFDLGKSVDLPGQLGFTDLDFDSKLTIVNTYLTYEVWNQGAARFDLGVGGRFYWMENGVVVNHVAGSQPLVDSNDSWVDPVIAARYQADFADKWFGTAMVDYGGFGVGSESTWQGLATIGYRVNDRFSLQAGYRFLNVERDVDAGDVDFEMSGPILGMTYRF